MKINFAAMFSNQVLPSSIGGDVVKTALATKEGLALGRAIRTVLLDRMTGLISLVFLIAATYVVIESYFPKEWALKGSQIIVVPILGSLLIILYNGAKISKFFQKFSSSCRKTLFFSKSFHEKKTGRTKNRRESSQVSPLEYYIKCG